MIKGRRKNYQLGGSKAVTYPSDITIGDEATLAGNRLLLIDPQGQIHEDDLAEFIETHLEPDFANWWRQKEAGRRPKVRPFSWIRTRSTPLGQRTDSPYSARR